MKELFLHVPLKNFVINVIARGTTRASAREHNISIEEVEKWLENLEFSDFVKSCILSPEQMKNRCLNSGIVKVLYPCTAEDKKKCTAWPDRCEECGGDGEFCGYEYVDLAKLCGIKNTDKTSENKDKASESSDPLLTPNEIKLLGNLLKNR